MGEQTQGDRVVVTGMCAGNQFPRTQAQLGMAWEANGNTSDGPFMIDGGVHGRALRFIGPGSVAGPVFGRGDIGLLNHTSGVQRFLGGISASGNIVVKGRSLALVDTLAGSIHGATHVLRGDVLANNVALDNTIVFGNIRADRVRLNSCIVIGAVIARDALKVTASTLMHYHVPKVVFEGPCAFLHVMGESQEMPVLVPYQDSTGTIFPPDFRYYPVLRSDPDAALTNRPWNGDSPGYRDAAMVPETDWVEVPVREPADGVEDSSRWVLSIAGRALNFGQVNETVQILASLLRTGLEFDHYSADSQQSVRNLWKQHCTPDELVMMHLATDPVRA